MPVKHKHSLDRSTAFTILLDVDPGFDGLEVSLGRLRVTTFLDDWYRSRATDMHAFAKDWVRHHPIEEVSP